MATSKKKKQKAASLFPLAASSDAVDKVRASKEGHRYHEAWLARRALELIFPRDGLVGIAVEGLHDERGMGQEAIEIADATFYFGDMAFSAAKAIQVEQFKYSISRDNEPFRASDAKKTLAKFTEADRDFVKLHGASAVEAKIRFGITTNRPIYAPLVEALRAATTEAIPKSVEGTAQLKQIETATGLQGTALRSLCQRLEIVGRGDTVAEIEGHTRRAIADWSASGDLHIRARIADLRELISKKAGISGQHNKTVFREDVLAALGVGSEDQLLPTPDAFPPVGEIIEREQLADFLGKLEANPLSLVHASGGIGKTVFVQSIAAKLPAQDEVVLFDCFGGGAYRVPADGRHRPERGLMHIVNELAARGLCDPILPGSQDPQEITRTALKRFDQAVAVLRRSRPNARLVIILDAMDNAGLEADDRDQPSFPRELFETFSHKGVSKGIVVIGTCRPERIEKAIGRAKCFHYPLMGFSLAETTKFVLARRTEATTEQIAAIQHRSAANPRVIFNLIKPPRPLSSADEDEIANLDSLIQERINDCVKLATEKGAAGDAVNGFLCALALLPPPVPPDELAIAFGVPVSAIESFAADLSPMLDRTRHGLIFRDEPTETLVRKHYGTLTSLLTGVVTRLRDAQGTSPYAARSLPGLLFAINDVAGLEALAFDERFPPTLTSEIAKRAIRLNRLQVAVAAATRANDADAMTALLVELSSVAVVQERGDDYFLKNPDLVMALGDAEATRRLYESKRGWYGARPSRLAIAYTLEGELGEAYDQARRSARWLQWLYSKREDDFPHIQPEMNDYAAWGLYLLEVERLNHAADFLAWWTPSHSFKVSRRVLQLDEMARALGKAKFKEGATLRLAMHQRCPPAYLAALLNQRPLLSKAQRIKIIRKLSSKVKATDKIGKETNYYDKSHDYRDGILAAALEAQANGLCAEAAKLRSSMEISRYRFWSIRDRISPDDLSPEFLTIALDAALAGKAPNFFDCLPQDFVDLVKDKACPATQSEQEKVVTDAINEAAKQGPDPKVKPRISGSDRYEWTEKLHARLTPIVMIATAIYAVLVARTSSLRTAALKNYFKTWEDAREFGRKQNYGSDRDLGYIDRYFLNGYYDLTVALGLHSLESAELLKTRLKDLKFKPPYMLISFVGRFALSDDTAPIAGELAAEVTSSIEQMDDTQERSSSYAQLSRALLPADRTEAAALFAKGYAELTAIGSGDYELATELLNFARQLERAPLDGKSAHMLAKIVELSTPYEAERFPWSLAAHGFCNAWNFDYLAQLARWDDRDKIRLEYTIGPAVTNFVEKGRLSPREGTVLLSLVDPVETHAWEIEHFLEAALKRTPEDGVALAEEYLDLLERKYPVSVSERELTKFEAIIGRTAKDVLPKVSARVSRLRAKQQPERTSSNSSSVLSPKMVRERERKEAQELKRVKALAAKTKNISADEFDDLVDKIDKVQGRLDLKSQAFADIRAKIHYSKRQAYVTAIVEAQSLELFAKLALLREAKEAWKGQSPSKLAYFKGLGLRLVEVNADEVLAKDWGFVSTLNELAELSGDTKTDIAIKLASLAATRELKADATAWLSLAEITAQKAKPEVPRDALKRILSSEAARLAEEVGDGKWVSEFEASEESPKVVAGLIWYSLGSPDTVLRWQAAHAVRRAAKLGLWDVLKELFVLFNGKDAGAFQDRKLPFFQMHAQLWLLTAIARIALDYPSQIGSYRATFERILEEQNLPHPAMQDAAARALVATFRGNKPPAKIKALLDHTNRSPFPVSSNEKSEFPYQRPTEKREDDFIVDYDFDKYEVAGVGRVFLLPSWKVSDDMVAIIRRWDTKVRSMHDFAGKQEPPGRSHSRQSGERFQSYGMYLGWHALAILGGLYLRQRPVVERSYEHDVWGDWLADYQPTRKDGLWPSDGTDPYPKVVGTSLREGSGKDTRPTTNEDTLLSLVNISNGKLGSELMIDGSWSSTDSVSVHIRSALVPPQLAEIAALAVATAPIHHVWLPQYEYYDEEDVIGSAASMKPIEAWLASQQAHYRFDQHDPYMSRRAMERARPLKSIAKRFGLVPDPVWFREWKLTSGNAAIHAEAWGEKRGRGDREEWDAGQSLICGTSFLGELLASLDRELILLVHLQHYKDRDEYGRDDLDDNARFTNSILVLLIGSNLKVRVVRPTTTQWSVVNKLSQYDKPDFEKRLAALLKPKTSGKTKKK